LREIKNIIKFDGDHNSPRPQFYFDSITIFFHNVLNPPDVPEEHYFMSPHGSLGQVVQIGILSLLKCVNLCKWANIREPSTLFSSKKRTNFSDDIIILEN
jgi:hypothetical protein